MGKTKAVEERVEHGRLGRQLGEVTDVEVLAKLLVQLRQARMALAHKDKILEKAREAAQPDTQPSRMLYAMRCELQLVMAETVYGKNEMAWEWGYAQVTILENDPTKTQRQIAAVRLPRLPKRLRVKLSERFLSGAKASAKNGTLAEALLEVRHLRFLIKHRMAGPDDSKRLISWRDDARRLSLPRRLQESPGSPSQRFLSGLGDFVKDLKREPAMAR